MKKIKFETATERMINPKANKLYIIIKWLYTKDKGFDTVQEWREALIKLLEETI